MTEKHANIVSYIVDAYCPYKSYSLHTEFLESICNNCCENTYFLYKFDTVQDSTDRPKDQVIYYPKTNLNYLVTVVLKNIKRHVANFKKWHLPKLLKAPGFK